jgi:hypothetical protein
MGALRPLVPEMAIEALGPGKHPVLEGSETSFRLFDGVLALVEAAAGDTPLLLSLYDLQWASELSLQLLVFLCYGMTGLPWCCSAPIAMTWSRTEGTLLEALPTCSVWSTATPFGSPASCALRYETF